MNPSPCEVRWPHAAARDVGSDCASSAPKNIDVSGSGHSPGAGSLVQEIHKPCSATACSSVVENARGDAMTPHAPAAAGRAAAAGAVVAGGAAGGDEDEGRGACDVGPPFAEPVTSTCPHPTMVNRTSAASRMLSRMAGRLATRRAHLPLGSARVVVSRRPTRTTAIFSRLRPASGAPSAGCALFGRQSGRAALASPFGLRGFGLRFFGGASASRRVGKR